MVGEMRRNVEHDGALLLLLVSHVTVARRHGPVDASSLHFERHGEGGRGAREVRGREARGGSDEREAGAGRHQRHRVHHHQHSHRLRSRQKTGLNRDMFEIAETISHINP